MVVLAVLVVVVGLDQATKWWAWRHVSWTTINSGGDRLSGPTIGAWYANPVAGALLDLVDFGLLSVVVHVLSRWRATAAVGVLGALMTGGWGSNLFDRLGMHFWTAPGSVRGVVDFIHLGGSYYNAADFFIIGGTPLFLLAAGYQGVLAARRPLPGGGVPPPARGRLRARARISALAGAGLTLVVALGAANYGGVSQPHPARASVHAAASRRVRLTFSRATLLLATVRRPCSSIRPVRSRVLASRMHVSVNRDSIPRASSIASLASSRARRNRSTKWQVSASGAVQSPVSA